MEKALWVVMEKRKGKESKGKQQQQQQLRTMLHFASLRYARKTPHHARRCSPELLDALNSCAVL